MAERKTTFNSPKMDLLLTNQWTGTLYQAKPGAKTSTGATTRVLQHGPDGSGKSKTKRVHGFRHGCGKRVPRLANGTKRYKSMYM